MTVCSKIPAFDSLEYVLDTLFSLTDSKIPVARHKIASVKDPGNLLRFSLSKFRREQDSAKTVKNNSINARSGEHAVVTNTYLSPYRKFHATLY